MFSFFSHLYSPQFSTDSGGGSGGDDDKDLKGADDDKGADDKTDSKKDKGEDKDEGEGQDDKPKMTHTKKDVDAAAGKARTSAESKTLKKLGVETLDEAIEKLTKLGKAEAAENTDLENANKDIEKLTKEKGDQDGVVKVLLSKVLSGAVKTEALDPKYKINPLVVNDLWKLIKNDEKIVGMLEIDEETFEVSGIEEAIKAAIEGREYMLVEEEDPKKKPGSPPRTTLRSKGNSKEPETRVKTVRL